MFPKKKKKEKEKKNEGETSKKMNKSTLCAYQTNGRCTLGKQKERKIEDYGIQRKELYVPLNYCNWVNELTWMGSSLS